MGVTKTIIQEGDGPSPKPGQKIGMLYQGFLKDPSKPDGKGKKFDGTDLPGRGLFEITIGVGQVIKGWDEGVPQMKLGEKALLDITSDYAYGDRGFPPIIPAKSDLLFEVELKKIG